MVEQVAADIYRIEMPLPRNPLKAVNAYLARGGARWLLIDTGMNRPECLEAMRSALAALQVDLARTDVFVTHGHSDHVGLVSELQAGGARILLNAQDAAVLLKPTLWTEMAEESRRHGFPDPETGVLKHPGRRYLFSGRPQFTPVREGDELRVGRYAFRCLETPGHTPGHTCLYEPEAAILVSGDHILDGITPNISAWSCGPDPLGEFLQSLEKVEGYRVRLILPAHRNAMRDHPRRVRELQSHHRTRLQEVTTIVAGGPLTAYEVASRMTWSIDCERWADFPVPQQWFATGEALSHLLHLERLGRIRHTSRNGQIAFALLIEKTRAHAKGRKDRLTQRRKAAKGRA
jgi:glyoxylase-like metal-dependent hydrolase (beta-lactamase superfamily II)